MGIPERKERERNQRCQQIIDAAERLFFTRGPGPTTMEEIAEAAELSKGTLYLYFKSKEDIQYEVSLRGANLLKTLMEEKTSSAHDGLEALLRAARVFIDFSVQQPGYFEMFIMFQGIDIQKTEIPEEKVEKYFLEQSPFTLIIELVERGISDGSIREGLKAGQTAAALWSQMLGLLTVQKYKSELYKIFGVSKEEVLETSLDLLLNGIQNLR